MRIKRNLSKKEWIILAVVLVLWLAISSIFGLGSSGSGLRVGWVDSSSGEHIQASYHLFRGYRQYQKNLGDAQEIHVQITTEDGSLEMEIRDETGLVYSEKDLQSGEFTVKASGRVTVVLTGSDHRGGFLLTWDRSK